MKPFISIIVPTKNAEDTILKTLESIHKQTYTNFEVICVDSSLDDSFSLISDFSKKDVRFKPIKVPFDGLARQRNYGVKKSSGEWITFIDGDDTIHSKYLEMLIEEIDDETGIICGNFSRIRTIHEEKKAVITKKKMVLDNISSCLQLETKRTTQMTLCQGKLIKRELIENYPVDETVLNEDEATTYKWYLKARKIIVLDSQIYNYYIYNNSLSSQHNIKIVEKATGLGKAYYERYQMYLNLNNSKLHFLGWKRLIETTLSYAYIFKNMKNIDMQTKMLHFFIINPNKKYIFSHLPSYFRICLKYIRAK